MAYTNNDIPRTITLIIALAMILALATTTTVPREVAAATVNASVQIVLLPPNATSIRCCFKDSDQANYNSGYCYNADSGSSYTITGGKAYDMMCNLTVVDPNGWQAMGAGWVNVTWYHTSVAWNSGASFDSMYGNSSCRNVSGSGNGINLVYECGVSGIKYWADGGRWNLLVNLSDGTNAGTPALGQFIIANVTSIWQSSSISFGSMLPGTAGSQLQADTVNVNSTTNNTGNTVINLEVSGGSGYMNCTIGAIPIGGISYDTTYQKSIATSCGQLTSSNSWDADCSKVNLQNCNSTCPNLEKIAYTYWGITIPSNGVGGLCSCQLMVMGVQANP